jgi:hypothetical protein
MKITLLGHASYVVQTASACVFMDPVFADPFHDGIAQSCPQREVDTGALPPPDAVVISHAHTDHYDPPSLALVDRDVPIYCTRDVAKKLQRIGRHKVRPLEALSARKVLDLTLLPTPSRTPDELGMVFADAEGCVWNQVDTVLDQELTVRTQAALGRALDVVIAGFMPLVEWGAAWVSEAAFPRPRYERMIEMALAARARLVVPGSAGIRCVDELAWINHRVYPASRAAFVEHLRSIAPEQASLLLEPGEALVVARDGVRKEASPLARVTRDDEHSTRRFAPDEFPAPPLADTNRWNYSDDERAHAVDEVIGDLRRALARTSQVELLGPLRTLIDRRAAVQLDVALGDEVHSWHIARWLPAGELAGGAHPAPDYRFGYEAGKICHFLRTGDVDEPPCRAERRVGYDDEGPFRLRALDPARLHGRDEYFIVDERLDWHLLLALGEPALTS